ncbi:MAG: hypothetical protein ACOY3I_01900 [Verrucomicrobiota bacterium]
MTLTDIDETIETLPPKERRKFLAYMFQKWEDFLDLQLVDKICNQEPYRPWNDVKKELDAKFARSRRKR